MKNNAIRKNQIVITVFVALLTGVFAFVAGMKYQEGRRSPFNREFVGQANQGGMRGNGQGRMQGFRPVTGEILTVDDTSITVKLPDGSSKIIILSEKTQIRKAQDGSRSDLKPGENITTFGQVNSDESITADSISIGSGILPTISVPPIPKE